MQVNDAEQIWNRTTMIVHTVQNRKNTKYLTNWGKSMFLTIKFASCLPKLILSGIFYCVISWQLQSKLYQHSKMLFLGNLTNSSCCLIRVPESLDSLLQKELVSFIVGSQDLYSYGFLKQTTLKVDWVAYIGKWYKIHNIYLSHGVNINDGYLSLQSK